MIIILNNEVHCNKIIHLFNIKTGLKIVIKCISFNILVQIMFKVIYRDYYLIKITEIDYRYL